MTSAGSSAFFLWSRGRLSETIASRKMSAAGAAGVERYPLLGDASSRFYAGFDLNQSLKAVN